MIIITLQGHEGEVCETNENELFVESDDFDTECSEVETSAVAHNIIFHWFGKIISFYLYLYNFLASSVSLLSTCYSSF